MADERYWSNGAWGAMMVIAGVWWLLGMFDVVPFRWDIFGPMALIVVGASMFLHRGRCGGRRGKDADES